jgi:hypothetical protein
MPARTLVERLQSGTVSSDLVSSCENRIAGLLLSPAGGM